MLVHRVDITELVTALADQWDKTKVTYALTADELEHALIIASCHELMLPNEAGGKVQNVFIVDEDAHGVLGTIGERVDMLGLNAVWASFMGPRELGMFVAQLAKALEGANV